MAHYFENNGINSLDNLKKISREDFKEFLKYHNSVIEVIDLSDKIEDWKRVLQEKSSSLENQSIPGTSSSLMGRKRTTRELLDFNQYFCQNLSGRLILKKFESKLSLAGNQKIAVIQRAAEFLILNIPNFPKEYPRDSEYESVANEIIELFPGVFSKSSLIGEKIKKDDKTYYTRGKLRQRLYDIKKNMNKQKQREIESADTSMDGTEIEDIPDENIENEDPLDINNNEEELFQKLKFLSENNGPEVKIREYWDLTYDLRQDMSFEDFPSLKLSYGVSMVLDDFTRKYFGKCEDFRQNFERLKPKMKTQFDMEISNKIGREKLNIIDSNVDRNLENLLYLSLLPFLFKPKTLNNIKKRPSIVSAADMFICHVKVS